MCLNTLRNGLSPNWNTRRTLRRGRCICKSLPRVPSCWGLRTRRMELQNRILNPQRLGRVVLREALCYWRLCDFLLLIVIPFLPLQPNSRISHSLPVFLHLASLYPSLPPPLCGFFCGHTYHSSDYILIGYIHTLVVSIAGA